LHAEGPCFLEVCTDREEVLYPKVPAGGAYRDMILGPYIREMSAVPPHTGQETGYAALKENASEIVE
ncbi:MAG: hypothetical protein JW705_00765, partial [Methanosarcinaceae archaeon]|nr:hypothetical protein [Methanosarcinaceae archaeon]